MERILHAAISSLSLPSFSSFQHASSDRGIRITLIAHTRIIPRRKQPRKGGRRNETCSPYNSESEAEIFGLQRERERERMSFLGHCQFLDTSPPSLLCVLHEEERGELGQLISAVSHSLSCPVKGALCLLLPQGPGRNNELIA